MSFADQVAVGTLTNEHQRQITQQSQHNHTYTSMSRSYKHVQTQPVTASVGVTHRTFGTLTATDRSALGRTRRSAATKSAYVSTSGIGVVLVANAAIDAVDGVDVDVGDDGDDGDVSAATIERRSASVAAVRVSDARSAPNQSRTRERGDGAMAQSDSDRCSIGIK